MIRSSVLWCSALAVLAGCARHKAAQDVLISGNFDPAFETRIEIPTDTSLHSDQVVADFNGDNLVDLAVVGFTGDLQVLIGSGSVFTAAPPMTLGGLIIWIDQGDFDRDGDVDLVVLRKDVGVLDILVNDGSGQFSAGPSYSIGIDSLQVLVADVNQDERLDLLVARPLSPQILVFEGSDTVPGEFTAGQSLVIPGGGQSYTMSVGDPSHDGVPDLVISDPSLERVLIYPGNALTSRFAGLPTILDIPGAPAACSVGDLTGDGLDDIAVSAYTANQFVVITSYDPSGGLNYTSISVPVEGRAALSTIGDVTGDGLPDLVACVIDRASVVVIPAVPGGRLGAPFQLDSTGLSLRPTVVDVDRNGRNDIVVLSGLGDTVNLWLSADDGRLAGARNYDSGLPDASHVVATDLDGDGTLDFVVADPMATRLAILHAAPDMTLTFGQFIDVGASVNHIRKFDIDLDGRDDLIIGVPMGVKVARNVSTPGTIDLLVQPNTTTTFGTGIGPYGATAVDIDRDGRVDLAIADFAAGNVQIVPGGNDPFDFSAAPIAIAVGGGPVDVAAADFTGDGIFDLAVSRSGQSDILILQNDGAGNLTPLINLPVGQAPNFLLTADFDGDGRSDLAVANGDGDSVSVLFAGAQGFRNDAYDAGFFPSSLLTQDLTGDGSADILVASRLGEDFRVLVNDGIGGFAESFTFPGTLGASGVAVGDLDVDGDLDLIIASTITNRVSVVNSLQAQLRAQQPQ
ncbi:MAG: FG-GAP repeat domain-containing protein [Planctomycetota bacterium]